MRLDADRKTLDRAIDQASVDGRGLGQMEWKRTLSQKGGQSVTIKGHMGLLQVKPGQGDCEPLVQLLHIGSLLHGGEQVAFGLGRYDLILMTSRS
ncbi:hypothetical protein [Cohaesibacter sp. ES.047]|uniref:hypothetical protein n=1 Tax=Cohaesibacter sp. ES.047 TaxID=1798205 RepID=UPI000BB8B369|nr:hypothetical protein [Cohaesibacter sp. ES.047]